MKEQEIKQKFTIVSLLLWAAALWLRFGGLGAVPLSEAESKLAFQALHLFDSTEIGPVGQQLYVLPTAILFVCFGAAEWTARLLPAVCGMAVVFLPYCMRERLGLKKALFLTAVLALEPTLLFWSKQADAQIIVIFIVLAAVVFLLSGKRLTALCMGFLAVCGGVRFWPLAAAGLGAFVLLFVLSNAFPEKGFVLPECTLKKKVSFEKLFLPLLVLLLFVTVFLTYPAGLGDLGSGLTETFRGAGNEFYVGIVPSLVALILYCGFPLFLVLTDKEIREEKNSFWFLFAAFAFLLLFLFGQSVLVLPWFALACWAAESERCTLIINSFSASGAFRKGPFRMAFGLIAAAWCFLFLRISEITKGSSLNGPLVLNLAGKTHTLPMTRMAGYLVILAVGLIIFFLIVRIFSSYFESWTIHKGYVAGIGFILSCVFLSNIWGGAGFSRSADHVFDGMVPTRPELLGGTQSVLLRSPLEEFLSDVSAKDTGSWERVHGLNVLSSEPLLLWYFRNDPFMSHGPVTSAALAESKILLDEDLAAHESEGFVGAVVPWKASVNWDRFTVQDWLNWLFYGDAPVERKSLTFWQRISLLVETAAENDLYIQGDIE